MGRQHSGESGSSRGTNDLRFKGIDFGFSRFVHSIRYTQPNPPSSSYLHGV